VDKNIDYILTNIYPGKNDTNNDYIIEIEQNSIQNDDVDTDHSVYNEFYSDTISNFNNNSDNKTLNEIKKI
jgi:hypothetical protein